MKIRFLLPREFEARKVTYDQAKNEVIIEPLFPARATFGDVVTVIVESDDGKKRVPHQLRAHGAKGTLSIDSLESAGAEFDNDGPDDIVQALREHVASSPASLPQNTSQPSAKANS